ncbi:MAG: hypothetical protein ACLQU4_10440 [Limisphaerales bacterium]
MDDRIGAKKVRQCRVVDVIQDHILAHAPLTQLHHFAQPIDIARERTKGMYDTKFKEKK